MHAEFCLVQELPPNSDPCGNFFSALGDLLLEHRHASRRARLQTSGEAVFSFACASFLLSAAGRGERGNPLFFCDDRRFLWKNDTVGTLALGRWGGVCGKNRKYGIVSALFNINMNMNSNIVT